MRVGIVAGESSGDLLAAALMQALQAEHPEIEFEGVAGPRMLAAGCRALYPAERLSVMGLFEVLGHLRDLLGIRRALTRHFTANPPDVFIGVDAPDFNIVLEGKLRRAGIRTVHYVSPSVWAWRRYRVRRIARNVDCMLTLFPFESEFYRSAGVPVKYVGHPLADRIPDVPDRGAARAALGLDPDAPVLALLPGSRAGEVQRLAADFIGAAHWCAERKPGLQVIVPLINETVRAIFAGFVATQPGSAELKLLDGRAWEAMAAADAVLTASGTATLEIMLHKRPMVVAYRLAPLTYKLAGWLVKVPYIALPNLLAGQPLVPEILQDEVTPARLGAELIGFLDDPARCEALSRTFSALHRSLRCDAGRSAAQAVLQVVGR